MGKLKVRGNKIQFNDSVGSKAFKGFGSLGPNSLYLAVSLEWLGPQRENIVCRILWAVISVIKSFHSSPAYFWSQLLSLCVDFQSQQSLAISQIFKKISLLVWFVLTISWVSRFLSFWHMVHLYIHSHLEKNNKTKQNKTQNQKPNVPSIPMTSSVINELIKKKSQNHLGWIRGSKESIVQGQAFGAALPDVMGQSCWECVPPIICWFLSAGSLGGADKGRFESPDV